MGKVKQRNWLLIITIVLFFSSILVLIFITKRTLGVGVCLYDGIEYEQNELVPGYDGRNDCYCSWRGEIICEEFPLSMSYDSFISTNLAFSYVFQNFLEESKPDLSRVTLSDVNHQASRLEIVIQREALCGEDGVAPTQIGMYERKEGSLILTTITNRDETLYSRTCMIGNTFVIEGFDIQEQKSFSILYQNENGQLYDLNACFWKNKLYGIGDVFKDVERNRLCSCEGPEVECEDL